MGTSRVLESRKEALALLGRHEGSETSPGGPWAWNPQQKEGYSKLRPYLMAHAAYTGLLGSLAALNFLGLRKVKKRAFSRASDQA